MKKRLYTQQQKAFRDLLRQTREEAGLRQQDLAERLGAPQPFVSKYESGERRLDVIELRQICLALRLPLIKFLRRLDATLEAIEGKK